MNFASVAFYTNSFVCIALAIYGLLATRSERTRVGCLLLSIGSLSGVFLLMGAQVMALAMLFFSAGVGLVVFFVNDLLGDAEGDAAALSSTGSWNWLVLVMGVLGASVAGLWLFELVSSGGSTGEAQAHSASATGFSSVGQLVLTDYGVALIGIALLLLASLIGAGFLARRGID